MLYGLYLSAAGLQAQETRQAVLTNNMANAQTAGFKRDLAVMQSRLNEVHENGSMARYRVPGLPTTDQGGGVTVGGTMVDLTQSMLKRTESPGDVALDGKGFFTVRGDQGEKLLTRDGQFLVSDSGQLVMATTGRAVLDDGGSPIQVKPGAELKINGRGEISQGGQPVAKLGLADVNDPRRLLKVGGNVMTVDSPDALTAVSDKTVVRQGQVEESGVDPMVEMVAMLEGQRAFDANAKMITYQDTTLQQVNTIGRVA
jgi:flagellar basal body rod protein FlgG